jgi:hypothetical protein
MGRPSVVYAIVSWWQLPENSLDGSLVELEPAIVPLARQASGFCECFWTFEPSNRKSVGFMLMDTVEGAHDLKNAIESYMEGRGHSAAQLEMIRVQKIVTHVTATPVSILPTNRVALGTPSRADEQERRSE